MERWRRWRGIFCHRNERIGSTLCTTITTCIYMPSLDTALSIYALELIKVFLLPKDEQRWSPLRAKERNKKKEERVHEEQKVVNGGR